MTAHDGRAFRDALGCFATGVTVITTRAADGALVGFTANSFSSVSLDPPLILFSLSRAAKCLPFFEASAHFAVNILSREQTDLSSRFASPAHDKWHGVGFMIGEGGSPVLDGAIAVFECAVHDMHDGGDHRIFIGRVLRMRSKPEGQPLLFCRGIYRELGPPLGAPADRPQPGSTSALDSGVLAEAEPWEPEG